ncbi:hypothetical protein F5Y19DRAFT_341869 [Xylariaceae sp. FL1651]|nr:hypothetical protein F5Y19DRAFT_341869 [Xylariaceae sp. FL1651]
MTGPQPCLLLQLAWCAYLLNRLHAGFLGSSQMLLTCREWKMTMCASCGRPPRPSSVLCGAKGSKVLTASPPSLPNAALFRVWRIG